MPTDTPQPSFVLVRPQMGENIGAAARAMWNFGLDRMRIVDPRDGWPNPAATAMASGAGRLLDEAQLAPDLPSALSDCHYVYATTARGRELTKPILSPEEAMQDAARRIADGQKVAVMFGPERSGLENEDVVRASAIITVPVNPDFPSLNLAQCVLLTAYEWRRASAAVPEGRVHMHNTEWASQTEIEALAVHYEDRMQEAGFFYPDHKATSMRQTLRNFWSRMPLTQADTRLLHGILRQMVRWKDRGDGGA
ncbi:tRNA/rRNA methyltransferase [Roseovarius nanhaiticus]|uniref:tRNA (cytidine/uridine-2'-O-)-methyltransferase TrmJ n=1 Tax=Roseovarius nanhaiticus TaxID=573024 RepID=A0A1N7HH71_9RHOB|nr:RNA methyltransferase [Roseovarius nanhaiticus]SEK94841.1 tRNA/rRNA methyltransferase [Roseovarius nanhaiticus]SIS24123.1 tRNA/rRNA methyltransferase [Roseovarius nanhaiticus]